ncbi:YggS family pyridoxal phosphate-dependent enzyme [Nocardia sp. XZ_19_231]|uniref:YggS family pyridoxal phosphate-dependent enzyme n=1 Tax=Nocardia sp. XZ_19_231 TaxID=2769252 RepID=UPI00188F9EAA|nr:YggS family pyridoxal phosphate-dependent enzyme [Nocardia sp. XZ_19_231]
MTETGRAAELSTRLDGLLARIDAAVAAAGRPAGSVSLLPVTKFFPATDVAILHALGRREFGESREQEASAKVDQLGYDDVEWHMIGRLQRNKARAVARWAHTVASVDSERLANALDRAAQDALAAGERIAPLRVLLQVSLDADPGRGGVAPADLLSLADLVAKAPGLHLAGLMAIPPLDAPSDVSFANLATLHTSLLVQHAEATDLSAGMSGDLEIAVEHGSTCVRVGTALMGARPITSA